MEVEKIRVSIGSASVLGLYEGTHFKDPPTTCYIMTYQEGRCIANCGFCPQAREALSSLELLSRVTWPIYNLNEVLTKLNYLPPKNKFKRICIQTLNYSENFHDLIYIISQIKKRTDIPISIAIPPLSEEKLIDLKHLGVDRVGIALDASTEEIFNLIKGKGVNSPYRWDAHFESLKSALKIFSKGKVSTHLIIGLGETSKEVIELMNKLNKLKITIGLFSFTPIKGTRLENLESPTILHFRKIQLARYLIVQENRNLIDFTFNMEGEIIKYNMFKSHLMRIIEDTDAFLTTGCPGCNRPYYTSKPSGPIYNYPRKLTDNEMRIIYNSLINYVN